MSFYCNTVTSAWPKTLSRERVIIEPSSDGAAARFGDPLTVDNAYSLLTYIVRARSSVRSRFPMHRSTSDHLSGRFRPILPAREIYIYRKTARDKISEEREHLLPTNPHIIYIPELDRTRCSIKLAFYRLKYRKFKLDNAENREITVSVVQLLVSLCPFSSCRLRMDIFSPAIYYIVRQIEKKIFKRICFFHGKIL